MSPHASAAPAFGAANLSNCEREQIHLAGCIQPHGALLTVREGDHVILQTSANAAAFLGLRGPLLGKPLRDLGGDLWRRARELPANPETIPYVVQCRLGHPEQQLDALLHKAAGGEVVIELEIFRSTSSERCKRLSRRDPWRRFATKAPGYSRKSPGMIE